MVYMLQRTRNFVLYLQQKAPSVDIDPAHVHVDQSSNQLGAGHLLPIPGQLRDEGRVRKGTF